MNVWIVEIWKGVDDGKKRRAEKGVLNADPGT